MTPRMSSPLSSARRGALALALLGALVPAAGLTAGSAASSPARPADVAAHHPTTALVAFEPGLDLAARQAAHDRAGAAVLNSMEWLNLDVVRTPEGLSPLTVSALYEQLPGVAYAHPNWEVRLLSEPDDTLFGDQWGLHNTGQMAVGDIESSQADADIDGPEGWDAAFGPGSFPSTGGVRVGVLDTGIDRTHADLLDKTKACASALTATGSIVVGSCSDDNSHGTHVGGTVAAITGNGLGVAGVAPNAELAVFKALNSAGQGFYADVIAGIHWLHASGGAQIINMSIGGPQDDALDRELSEAYAAGTLLVAAAGNDGDDTANWPAFHPDVISVGATTSGDEHAWWFSNCNADVELSAPGVAIWSTTPGNTYAPFDGTSMATPHVSGVAAMVMWQQGSSAHGTRTALQGSADDLGSSGRDSCFGYGRVNLATALGTPAGTEPPPPADPGTISGAVSDATNGSGIGGATVDCGEAGSDVTDAAGAYTIDSAAAGTWTCTASATGYRSKSQTVTVTSGETTVADFALRSSNKGGPKTKQR